VHKHWRTAFIVIFILSKLLLAAAIYFSFNTSMPKRTCSDWSGRSAGTGENKILTFGDSPLILPLIMNNNRHHHHHFFLPQG
jgi:hypothetical protein